PVDQCAALLDRINNKKIIFLAEKVETREEYQTAKEVGFTLFQGFFFCKPTIITGKRIPDSKLSQMHLLREAHQEDLDLDKIEKILKSEVSMSYKLLRFINSARFGLRHEVKSIRQSLCLLGQNTLRKWISLAALTTLGFDKPPELLVTALVRARFCELLSRLFKLEDRADELFLMGMFSTIDALLDMPMERIVKEIGLAPDLQAALLGQTCPLTSILNVAIGYEAGKWELFEESKKGHDLNEEAIPSLHLEAVKMAEELLEI
ncbi:MAG: HDOD domain-containing protein, partial [Planctomycetes bacterium]|nr:HDOD domain-containing protein [Planctomycetota bacterium]